MKIPVIYKDGTYGVVDSNELEDLLQHECLLSFQRSSGWVKVGADELRDRSGMQSSSWKDRKDFLNRHNQSQAEG
ncbi:MAG: hypothetical protein HXX11_19125 [Desulfuromonadales bacterium]|nr:hypothetical protein [Desulfuromonadales bacterium]